MQYPPQPPAEQPLTDGPERDAAPVQEEIVIYANRIKASRSLDAMLYRMIIVGLISFPLSYIILSLGKTASSLSPLLPFGLILFADVLLFAKIALTYWVTRRSLLLNDEPVMFINSEGISMRGALSLNNTFIAWPEIESLDIYTYKYKYLCVRPKNAALLMKRIPLLERLLKLSYLVYGIPQLSISLLYLDKPVEEILQQLYHIYAKELSYYHVQIRS